MTRHELEAFFQSLTAGEAEILDHRLEVGDAIAANLTDSEDTGDYSREEFEDVAEFLLCRAYTTAAQHPAVAALVLEESVNGSAWCGTMSQESEQKQAAARRVARSLSAKVSKFLGVECDCPEY